ncbi:ComEC/Rec2 family competence protein [uncultured Dokdonia sp.]|uniref:ComEC/Rec2 family competence protein n=1 Tax=uncultured Dokdonia sp. TaxID=575653 RepID=UPI00260A6580|nr:ComEC/Rec2 family competence protein [uncultured Dokdonia sp.]
MKSYNTLLAKATIAFIMGIMLYPYTRLSLFWCCILIGFFYGIAGVFHSCIYKNKKWTIPFGISILALFLLLGIGNTILKNPLNKESHYTNHNDHNTHTYLFSVVEKLKSSPYHDKYIVQLKKSDSTQINGKALLSVQKDSIQNMLTVGHWYYTRTSLKELPNIKNPYQFEYGNYLKRKHIYGQFSIKNNELFKGDKITTNIYTAAIRFRESVLLKLKRHPFTKQQLTIIQALLLGQKQDIDRTLSNQYANAGMMHILAVSGLHVGIILLILRFMTSLISNRKLRWLRSGMIIGLLWGFAFITGLSPSVLRAVTMFSFLEFGACLGGKRRTHDALLFSAFILLVIDPSLIYQVGFQLSYLAVIAILWIQPWLYSFYRPKYYVITKLWGVITVSIAAQIGVLPLSIFYFHQFPGLFLISNVVVLPFLGIILSIGILVVILSYFSILPDILAIIYGKIINLLNKFISWIASKETFVFDHLSLSLNNVLLVYALIISLIYVLKKYQYKRMILFLLLCAITLSIQLYQRSEVDNSHLTIFHKYKETLIGIYASDSLVIYTDTTNSAYQNDSRIEAYKNRFGLDTFHIRNMQNYFSFKHQKTLVIDSLGVYKIKNVQPDYILLRQSPDINLERLIALYPEVSIIADGSNYKSDITRWKTTCHQLKIPFHSTYEKGFFMIE